MQLWKCPPQIMFDFFQNTARPKKDLFFRKNDPNDIRLGEVVSFEWKDYKDSEIVILGCPQDEGVARNNGRIGAALAPDVIRSQFYELTNFGISRKIFDLGNTKIQPILEETHDLHTKIVEQVLRDNKLLIVLGGGNDVSYADGAAMANVYGADDWQAFNIDAHFDVRADSPRNSGTPYRQLLEEKFLSAKNFYEVAYQIQANSKIYYDYLQNLGAGCISLDEFEISKLKSQIKKNLPVFWGFDTDAVRASDAPGVSAPSPIGLSAKNFIELAETAANFENTKMIEFTEVNPNFDIDNRTAKLVAIAMHAFCAKQKS